MKFSAQLDVNMIALESDDEVALLLDLVAPTEDGDAVGRAGTALQIVLDRSGSMAGAPLSGAQTALAGLVDRLDDRDSFGVVIFDDQAEVVVPAGPLVDKAALLAQIARIQPGGSTDLSSGYLRGLQEIKRVAGPAGGTLLLISDGHVNAGVNDPAALGAIAQKAHAQGLITSTLGYGLGYDETLLTAITRGGSGNHHFAQDPDAAGAAIASEVTDLLSKSVLAVSLTVSCSPEVEMLRLYNDLPATNIGPGQIMIELGDFYAAEARKLLLKLKVPAMASLGLTQIAQLELRYVELPQLLEHVVALPITVNVVSGDRAAGRVVDPSVRTELIYQEAQQSKRLASEALERGDRDTAKRLLRRAAKDLKAAGGFAPDELRADITREVDELTSMRTQVDLASMDYTSKLTRSSYHQQNRKRGRRPTE